MPSHEIGVLLFCLLSLFFVFKKLNIILIKVSFCSYILYYKNSEDLNKVTI